MAIFNQIATASDERPAGKPGECFYCKAPIGHPHGTECIIPSKIVRIRATFEYEREVPASWDEGMIDFSLNESSSCADNELDRIAEYAKTAGCACPIVNFEYLGPKD